jgi:hypothetical protein
MTLIASPEPAPVLTVDTTMIGAGKRGEEDHGGNH